MRKILFAALAATSAASVFAEQKEIRSVRMMPREPAPYSMRDWNKVARDYDAFVFDFEAKGKFLPVVRVDREHNNYRADSFALVSYVGQDVSKTTGEGINCLAAVIGATLAGIDKSDQNGHNFVAMCQKWFNSDNGQNVYLNGTSGTADGVDWYELLVNILAFQLNSLYPGTENLPRQVITIANRYYDGLTAIGGKADPWTVPDFLSLPKAIRKPQTGRRNGGRQADNAAALAWIEYMAWVQSKDPKYRNAAEWGIQYLENHERDPLFEILLPYGAYTAARMNAELDRNYDVGKLLDWCFDGNPEIRKGWGVIAGNWSGLDAYGLMGSRTDGEGYAFAMNTYQLAGALAPLVRYDDRYAHDIGKWLLNLANASRLFYPNALDPAHQPSYQWSHAYDKNAVIAYEGIRKWKRGANVALSDFRTARGRILSGSFASTHYRGEQPLEEEVLEEANGLEHIWNFDLPDAAGRWLVVMARCAGGSQQGCSFHFSYATAPDGPFASAFMIPGAGRSGAQVLQIPQSMNGKLYLKVESSQPSSSGSSARLSIDAIAITYRTDIGPFAQGDAVVSFIDLINDATVPIVLYRPESTMTDLGLYGSSHSGILGGIVRTTNVEKILQLDLLKTDYYHGDAYPSYLYYNPYESPKVIDLEVGAQPRDLYDAVSNRFIKRGIKNKTSFSLDGDTAAVIVLAPANGNLSHNGAKTLINGVAVDYRR